MKIFKEGDKVFAYPYGWGDVSNEVYDDRAYIHFPDGLRRPISNSFISFTEYDLEKGGLSQNRPELGVGKSYRSRNCSKMVVINRIGNYGNYGFNHNGFTTWLGCCIAPVWQEIPESEAIALLEKECVKRYGEGWKDVKIKECIHHKRELKIGSCIPQSFTDQIWNNNGCIFKDGVWAEKLEDPKIKEGQMIWVKSSNGDYWLPREFIRFDVHGYAVVKLTRTANGIWTKYSILNPNKDSIEARAIEILRMIQKSWVSFDAAEEFLKEIDTKP